MDLGVSSADFPLVDCHRAGWGQVEFSDRAMLGVCELLGSIPSASDKGKKIK